MTPAKVGRRPRRAISIDGLKNSAARPIRINTYPTNIFILLLENFERTMASTVDIDQKQIKPNRMRRVLILKSKYHTQTRGKKSTTVSSQPTEKNMSNPRQLFIIVSEGVVLYEPEELELITDGVDSTLGIYLPQLGQNC
ncbi:MAG: hypothetical protein VB013_12565 [Anaerolineaceae bacterium]|nr:hypothetical protein [Anaerolineaceae bacterium]